MIPCEKINGKRTISFVLSMLHCPTFACTAVSTAKPATL